MFAFGIMMDRLQNNFNKEEIKMANYTIENLINDSVRVHKGMIIVYPQYNNAEDRINFEAATFNGSFASNVLKFKQVHRIYVCLPSTGR